MLSRAIIGSVLLAGAAATAGYAAVGGWQIGVIGAGLAGLWLVARRRGWHGLPSLLFLGFILLAALGVTLPGGALWAPLCLAAALAAWDLDRFAGRLAAVTPGSGSVRAGNNATADAETADLERRHLLRLAVVVGLGLGLAWAGQAIHLKLSLTVMLVLGLVAIVALSRVVRLLARESD